MKSKDNYYRCAVCTSSGTEAEPLSSYMLKRHLRCQHNLSLEEYCYRHLEGRSEWPLCLHEGCAKGPGGSRARTNFYKLCEIKKVGSAFGRYCSHECAMKHLRANNLEWGERAKRGAGNFLKKQWADEQYREQARIRSSQTIQRQWQTQEFREAVRSAQQTGVKPLSGVATRLNAFRSSHDGRSPYEDLLWKNARFQELSPIHNYKKFSIRINGKWAKQYMLDFYIESLKLCIEVDGWSHKKTKDEDAARDRYLFDTHGVAVIRVSNEEVEKNIERVVDDIHSCALALQLYS